MTPASLELLRPVIKIAVAATSTNGLHFTLRAFQRALVEEFDLHNHEPSLKDCDLILMAVPFVEWREGDCWSYRRGMKT